MACMDRSFPMTRADGLARLSDFAVSMGSAYAGSRNTDRGPDEEATTSALSPYLRRRLLLEREVAGAAVAAHGHAGERFVHEVFWRSYFKGYLETRPALWTDYQRLVEEGRARMAASSGLRRAVEDAMAGRTGIDGYDDWARELEATGWLHNHARMWFASIWIFTLRLPWALGADLFLRRLIDGDPASNTLSWRWVAGLHTRGKPYAARAENIRRYTDGRFDPVGLVENPVALQEEMTVAPVPLPPPDTAPQADVALLLHGDDLNPESLPLGEARVRRVGGLLAHPDGASARVVAANQQAMADALARAEAHFGCPAALATEGWAEDLPVLAAWAPVGPSASALPSCLRLRRNWDSLSWPHAGRGFFQMKSAIPAILRAEGVPG